MPTVTAPSIAGASTRSTVPLVFPDSTVQREQSLRTEGSSATGAAGDPVTTVCTMPPGPEADQPFVGMLSPTGPASTPHCGGSVVQPGLKPQNATGEARPSTSAISYPAGRSPRVRLIRAGFTCG